MKLAVLTIISCLILMLNTAGTVALSCTTGRRVVTYYGTMSSINNS